MTAPAPNAASAWLPIETAPNGFRDGKFHHVLFRGHSKGHRSFSGVVVVSGWMDRNREPAHNYAYKLIIIEWMEIPK